MAKFRTTGSCPAVPNGCGNVLDKEWSTITPEKVVTHVRSACPKCGTEFMATNTPVPESNKPANTEHLEITQDPLNLFIEYAVTTIHKPGDPLPDVIKKPTGRVRRTGQSDGRRENWFELPLSTIEKLVQECKVNSK